MALDYETDLNVSLETETEYKSLYSWCLKETNNEGKQVGRDWIPFAYSVNFYATSFTTYSRFATDWAYNHSDEGDDKNRPIISEATINAKLKIGYYDDSRWWRSPPISMLGSSRNIEEINLRISRVDDAASERCSIWGTVAYECEIDFRDERTEDCLEISIYLEGQKFDNLFNLISRREVDRLSLRLSLVKGFYSEWSPSISPEFIKVLENAENQGLQIDEEWKEKIPTLGKVGEFSLSVEKSASARLPKYADDDNWLDDIGSDEVEQADSMNLRDEGSDDSSIKNQRHSFYERSLSRISKLIGILILIELVKTFVS
jgi:hypothetical protein